MCTLTSQGAVNFVCVQATVIQNSVPNHSLHMLVHTQGLRYSFFVYFGNINVKHESLSLADFVLVVLLCVLSCNLSFCGCVMLETVIHVVRSLKRQDGREKETKACIRIMHICKFSYK